MPITGFLDVPDIKGESKVRGHKDEIDIQGLRWGVTSRSPGASGRRRVRASVHDLTVLKSYDRASPLLTLATLRGQAFDEIVLTVRKDGGDAHLDYLKVTMTNCILTDYQMENGGTDDPLTVISEAVDIEFETIRILYVQQADDHSAGDAQEVEFDVVAGV